MSIVTYVQGISEALRAFLETAYESASRMSTIEQCRGRHDIADENAGITRGQGGASQIRTGQRDVDRSSSVAGIRRKSRDRRRPNSARVARDGEEISNRQRKGDSNCLESQACPRYQKVFFILTDKRLVDTLTYGSSL